MVREATGHLSAEMRARLAWTILLPALMLGVLADALIRATPPGLGVPLWTAVLVITIAAIWWRRRETFRGVVWWLPAVALLGAGGIAWRDSPALKALDLLIVMLALALTSIRAPAIQLHVARLNHLALAQ